MRYILPPVAIWCVGQVCSMASLLLAVESKDMGRNKSNDGMCHSKC